MPYISTEQVKAVRENLKKAFPQVRFSVTKDNHSGVSVAILSGPYQWDDLKDGYKSLNVYYLQNYQHTDFLQRIHKIMNAGNGVLVEDGDYGTVPRFYTYLTVGQYHKPYQFKPAPFGPKINNSPVTIPSRERLLEMARG